MSSIRFYPLAASLDEDLNGLKAADLMSNMGCGLQQGINW